MVEPYFYSLKGEKLFFRKPGTFFISIEGSDGAGKSTQTKILTDYFISQGVKVIATKEPDYSTASGQKIKRMLFGKEQMVSPREFQKIYTENRHEHAKSVIQPALQEGISVICDRYFFATFAHAMLELDDISDLIELNNIFPNPDLALTILADPEQCLKRLREKNADLDFFEDLAKIRKIDENYKMLAKVYPNMKLIDGNKSIAEVSAQCINLIQLLLK